jgi:hypothetical protein
LVCKVEKYEISEIANSKKVFFICAKKPPSSSLSGRMTPALSLPSTHLLPSQSGSPSPATMQDFPDYIS